MMSPMAWLFLGYSVIWVGIVLFLLNMGRRQAALERQVQDLEKALTARR